MRWGFKLPDRHLFTARSEGIDRAQFWKDSFQLRRCIIPADAIFEWAEVPRGKKPKYEVTIPGREPFGIAGVWKLWKNPRMNVTEPTFILGFFQSFQTPAMPKGSRPGIVTSYLGFLPRGTSAHSKMASAGIMHRRN